MSFLDRFSRSKASSQLPEIRLQSSIGGNFEEVGNEYLDYFLVLGELEPYETLLDVGCGCGRMAIPLTSYLNSRGQYYGFDIVKEGITWCQKNISSRYRNFHFTHADIYNQFYNATGKIASDKYIFPYPDNTFDLTILTSVFTHLLPPDMEHYLSEISRTLKPDGRCLITYFLLNEESRKCMEERSPEFRFIYGEGVWRTIDAQVPELAISFDETYIRELFARYNLTIAEPIHYGSWCNRDSFLSGQDIILARKNA